MSPGAQGKPLGIALLEFGHGSGAQGVGADFIDHWRILQMTKGGRRYACEPPAYPPDIPLQAAHPPLLRGSIVPPSGFAKARRSLSRDGASRPADPAGPRHLRSDQRRPARARALSRSGRLLAATLPSLPDLVTASAATAASFSVIFAMIASLARSNTPRLVATKSCDCRRPARYPLISGTT